MMPRSEQDETRYPRDFWLALGAAFFFFSCFHFLLTSLPLYVQDLGGSETQIGLVVGAFALSAIVARPLVGGGVDRWGRKPSLLTGALISTVASLAYMAAHSVWAILAVRVFHGAGMAFFTTGYFAMVTDLAPPGRRGEALALAGMAPSASLLFAPLAGARLLQGTGFRAVLIVSCIFGLLSLIAVSLVGERFQPRREHSQAVAWKEIVARPAVVIPLLIVIVVGVSFGAVVTFLPLFATERGVPGMGHFFTLYAAVNLLGQPWAGRLSDRLGRRRVTLPGLLLMGISFALLGLCYSSLMLLGAAAAYGLAMGLARPSLDAAIADGAPPEGRGIAMGFDFACFDLGVGLGSFGLGVVAAAWGYGYMYGAVALSALLAALTLALGLSWEVKGS